VSAPGVGFAGGGSSWAEQGLGKEKVDYIHIYGVAVASNFVALSERRCPAVIGICVVVMVGVCVGEIQTIHTYLPHTCGLAFRHRQSHDAADLLSR
jgi:hypothetical protein